MTTPTPDVSGQFTEMSALLSFVIMTVCISPVTRTASGVHDGNVMLNGIVWSEDAAAPEAGKANRNRNPAATSSQGCRSEVPIVSLSTLKMQSVNDVSPLRDTPRLATPP